MKAGKWALRLTCLGLGGLGAMLLSERGRKAIRTAVGQSNAAGRMAAWTDSAKQELDHIQQELQAVESALDTHHAH